MILQLLAILKLAFIAYIGYISYSTTPRVVNTLHEIDVQGTKICFDGDYKLHHFFEERVVEMEASHDKFMITNTDIQKPFFNNLLNRSISDSLPKTKEFNHLIDTKIEKNVVTVVIPSYQKTCFEFLVEVDTEPLTIDIHSTTQLCYSTFIFFTLQIILFLIYPHGFVYEILALIVIFLFMLVMPYVHPLLMKYPIYQDTISPKYVLPLLHGCDTICLIIYHSMKFYCNFASYFFKNIYDILEKYFAMADAYIVIFTQWVEKWIMIIDEKIPSKEFIYEWLKLYWRECIVSVILFIITIYIFYPSHHDYSVEIRLICDVALSLSLAYISTSLAMKVVCFSILFSILIIKIEKVLQTAWRMIKRLFNHA